MRRAAILFVLATAGCDRKPQDPSPSPGESVVTFEDGTKVHVAKGHGVKYTVTEESVGAAQNVKTSAKGPGITTDSESVAQNLKVDGVSAGDSGSSSQGFAYSGTLTGGKRVNIFHLLGAACILLAGVAYYFTHDLKRSAIALAVGLAFIAIGVTVETYPLAWLAGGVVILILGAVWVYDARKSGRLSLALNKVVRGVSGSEEGVRGKVKDSIAQAVGSDSRVKKVVEAEVSKAKQREGV